MAATFIDLSGRVSIVTGGSRGIGSATAFELAKAGSDVAIFDVLAEEASATAARVAEQTGVKTHAYAVDISKAAQVRRAIDAVANDFGAIDHLINNAGIQYVSPIAEFEEDKWELVTGINLDGVFYATKYVWPHMVSRERGRIVNISSVHGLFASPFKSAYIAAKHGVIGLTRSAALEGASLGITVNAVCPGAVLTELVKAQGPALAKSYGGGISEEEAMNKAFLEGMPIHEFIDPTEVGQLCTFLCSDAARHLTGAPYMIDCGWSAH